MYCCTMDFFADPKWVLNKSEWIVFEIIIERHDILKTSRVPDRSRPQGVFSEPTSREFSKCRPTGNVINVNPVSSFSAKIKRKFGHFVRFNHIGCFLFYGNCFTNFVFVHTWVCSFPWGSFEGTGHNLVIFKDQYSHLVRNLRASRCLLKGFMIEVFY